MDPRDELLSFAAACRLVEVLVGGDADSLRTEEILGEVCSEATTVGVAAEGHLLEAESAAPSSSSDEAREADDEAATTEAPAPAQVAREEDADDTPGSSAAASVANEPDAALELRQENDELRGEVLRLRESLALAADEPPPTDDDGTALQALRDRSRAPARSPR